MWGDLCESISIPFDFLWRLSPLKRQGERKDRYSLFTWRSSGRGSGNLSQLPLTMVDPHE